MATRAGTARKNRATTTKDGRKGRAPRKKAPPQPGSATALERSLRQLVEHCWSVPAEELFPGLVRRLCEILGLDHALVSARCADGATAETVAVYSRGKLAKNIRYPLKDTPCENVMGGALCRYPRDIRKLFPRDTLLKELGAESYIGIPLWDSQKELLGLIAVLDSRPMRHADVIAGALRLVSSRAAMELERRRAEGEQRFETQRMALHVEQTPLAVIEWDLDFRVRGWNPAAERIFGFRREEAIGRHASFIVPESSREQVNTVWRALLSQEGGTRSTNENITKGCRLIMCEWFNTPLVDSDGKTVGAASLVADVTERHRAERQRARLSMAVEQAAESIMITDTEGTMLYVNPAFESITGYRGVEAIGRNASLLKSGRHDAAFYREMWDTIRAGRVWRGTFVNRRKDGGLFEEEAIISPVRNATGEILNYVAVKRDVTRERQVEEQLRQSQKMHAIGQLAGGVAHDFNNVLNVILGYSDMLLEDGDLPEGARAQIREIARAAERAAALTRQLLAFSRKQILDPRVFDLSALVADMGKMLRRLIGEHIGLHLIGPRDPCTILADPGQIEQVIMNLCVNARDAMPRGGDLTIETRRVTGATAPGCLRAPTPGECVLLRVRDTGAGMNDEVKARLFEPFFTTKTEGTGIGLGLATAYGIVKQSGGEISFQSDLGHGTTFEIRFPLAAAGQDPGESSRPPSSARPSRGETVLLVEDDTAVRHMVERLLGTLGYRVLVAENGEAALALQQAEGERPIDLLLTDVIMPGMNGREVAARIKAARPSLKVIFTSGYAEEAIAQDGILDPGITFLPKPFVLGDLAAKIREILEG